MSACGTDVYDKLCMDSLGASMSSSLCALYFSANAGGAGNK